MVVFTGQEMPRQRGWGTAKQQMAEMWQRCCGRFPAFGILRFAGTALFAGDRGGRTSWLARTC